MNTDNMSWVGASWAKSLELVERDIAAYRPQPKENNVSTLTVGLRVQTPLGNATILGFETFTAKGNEGPWSDTDNGGRVVVRLDEPENWLLSKNGHHPYMFRSDLSSLNETP